MKKITLLLTALIAVSMIAVAQIKMCLHLGDGTRVEYIASNVDSITFTNFPVEPDDNIGGDDVVDNEEEPEFPEILPSIKAPSADSVTIAIYVPENTCNGVILVGTINYFDIYDHTYKFKSIEGEDERWLQVTIPFDDYLRVKAIAIEKDGEAEWTTQWGMNIEDKSIENVVILQGFASLDNSENGGEVTLTDIPAGEVVYVGVKAWEYDPCRLRNPAGTATFTLTAPVLPEGAVVGVVGSLNYEHYWDISNPIVMTKVRKNTWTATAEVQAKCQYRYLYSLDGGYTWYWSQEEGGFNRDMALDLNAVDIVEEWQGLEWW